jgi:5-methylcytosine-specific restriction endonuclease McrA
VKRNFCSVECHNAAQVNQLTKICKICSAPFKVRPSDAARYSTCSEACYRKAKSEDRNGNWRGGVTRGRKKILSTARYKRWRRAVFERDDFTCVDCGQRGGSLEADHVKQWAHYPRLRYAVSNGATRCADCHRRRRATHRRAYQFKLPLKVGTL